MISTRIVANPPAGVSSIVKLSFTEPSIAMNGYRTDHTHTRVFSYFIIVYSQWTTGHFQYVNRTAVILLHRALSFSVLEALQQPTTYVIVEQSAVRIESSWSVSYDVQLAQDEDVPTQLRPKSITPVSP